MAVTGNSELNLRHPQLLKFVADGSRRAGDICVVLPDDQLVARNFVLAVARPDPGRMPPVQLITGVRRQYDVTQNGQSIGSYFLTMPLTTSLSVSLSTIVGCAANLPKEAKDAITAAFKSYNFADGKSPEEFAAEKMAEYNAAAAQKIKTTEFDLFISATYGWDKKSLDDGQEKWLREVYEGNGQARVPGLIKEGKNLGGSGYKYRFVKDEYLTDLPDRDQGRPEQVIPVRSGTVGDNAKEDAIVRDHAEKNARKMECEAMEPIRLRITDIKLADNTKTEFEWGYIENGCGGGFHFWRPILYRSEQRKVLYAVTTYRSLDARFKYVFESSLKEAAEGAAVLAIVFESFELGLAAFKALFWKLIKQKANETIECLVPDLLILNEDGPWVRS